MAQRKHARIVGLLVLIVGLALVMPTFASDDECEGVLPGDGVDGPRLRYRNNRNGTITDHNTGLVWEKKLALDHPACTALDQANRSVHCMQNAYLWSDTGTDPDGSLFDDFLARLNNRCERDESLPCTRDRDCRAVGGKCGFAGKRDWRIPNVRELQSIVDYGVFSPALDADFGPTIRNDYWSSTSFAAIQSVAWAVVFNDGTVRANGKDTTLSARAVRGCR
jgi:hypothetical protein